MNRPLEQSQIFHSLRLSLYPSHLDRFTKWVLLSLVFLLPLAISPWTASRYDLPKLVVLRIATALLMVLWLTRGIGSARFRLVRSPLRLPILSFLLTIAVSASTSRYLTVSLHGRFNDYSGLYSAVNFILLHFLALNLIRAEWKDAFFWTVVSSAALASIYGILQYFGSDILSYGSIPFDPSRPWSSIGNPILLAGYLILVLPVIVTKFLAPRKSKIESLALVAAFLLVFICLIFASTRSAWLGFVGSLLFVMVCTQSKPRRKWKITLTGLASILLTLGLLSLLGLFKISVIKERILSIPNLQMQGGRLPLWSNILPLLLRNPLFGSGPDTFHIVSPLGGGGGTHNEFLNIAATTGFFGLFAFLSIVVTLFLFGARISSSRRSKRPVEARESTPLALKIGLLGGCLAYLIHLFFNFGSISTSAYFWLFTGVILSSSSSGKDSDAVPARPATRSAPTRILIAATMVLLLLVPAAFFNLRLAAADSHYKKGLNAESLSYTERALTEYERATVLYPNQELYFVALGRTLLSKALGSPTYQSYYLTRAMGAYQQALTLNPSSPEARINRGIIFARMGLLKKAVAEWKKVVRFDPSLREAYWCLGRAYESMGRAGAAAKAYQSILTLDPKNREARKALEGLESRTKK